MRIQSKYDITGFDNWIQNLTKNRKPFYYWNVSGIHFAKRNGNKIFFSSHLTRAKVSFDESSKMLCVKVQTFLISKIFAVLPTLVSFPFLYSSKVTINGNSDPSFLSRLGVFVFSAAFTVISLFILSRIKEEFQENIKKEFSEIKSDELSE